MSNICYLLSFIVINRDNVHLPGQYVAAHGSVESSGASVCIPLGKCKLYVEEASRQRPARV